ncbi:chloride channel protein [Mucilaginibacter arboris]|uniref:CBS domain-containing protein n=1 Tax=Mucilaginibacter arboris TaxID=2682090 RepID=A0A7K1SVM1_9SPHI|nr:chloride channel protein [Mucilaginibacter arboris]MVN21376.1 CBS domain-containing protein [Mucilaginibacter arboris]
MNKAMPETGIPVSPILEKIMDSKAGPQKNIVAKKRLLKISVLAVLVAAAISIIAKFLIYLINLVTNISFYGKFDINYHSPANNHLGLWAILIPAIGGVIVGFMALYGSKAIRGHGIPEAMEQILVNQSKIKPSLIYLKPLSSAIAIGTGGPFGAEGPIIATGGALGSTLGQLFKITSGERKIILAAGATAGMSAIFGTPIAAVFLAIELLLFEFSPRAILPVALACITGAAGHHLLFEAGPVFPMPDLTTPSNVALGIYSALGIIVGFLSLAVTKIVYFIEDNFEKLPIHWQWWPAIGGLVVGLIGYFAPHTLGVGYDNITSLLSGSLPLTIVLSLLFFKFLSWAIALGSGTSGGTLAPLLTLGGAAGAVLGALILSIFPNCGISIPLAALTGMAAMFAGASRAYLTSITFALEATMQSHALLPLLGACTASYLVSFFLMENTIMTEKIARRGVFTPDSFEPDSLGKLTVSQVMSANTRILREEDTVKHIKDWLSNNPSMQQNYFIAVTREDTFAGILQLTDLYKQALEPENPVRTILKSSNAYIQPLDSLRKAVNIMSAAGLEILPVVSSADNKVTGVLTSGDILNNYSSYQDENEQPSTHISFKRQRLKLLLRRKKLLKA